MAKQRPSLGVSASPISTYVAPVAAASAGLELYDQQTVNLALQFSEAFQNLSLTAANFAGSLKAESNKEELQKGLDLVNSSQKTYQQLVEDGQIRPTENPWLAIGAQQGSGMMEGMKARAHFMEMYQKRAAEDPKFYDSLDSFNALASQYAQNVGTSLKNSPYQSRAFFEAFNPFVSSMSLKHQENVAKTAENKVLMGVGASVAQLTQDIKPQSQGPSESGTGIGTFLASRLGMGSATCWSNQRRRTGPQDSRAGILWRSSSRDCGRVWHHSPACPSDNLIQVRQVRPTLPPPTIDKPNGSLVALSVIIMFIMSIALISGVIVLTEWVAETNVVNGRQTFAIALGLTLMRVIDIGLFRPRERP